MINIRKLESELWESADLLRAGSKLTSNQYCMPVLGLIFLRYAYSRFKLVETEILKNRPSRGGRVLPIEASDFAAKSALYLPKEAQYEYLLNLPEDISVAGLKDKDDNDMKSLGEVVNNAMSLIEEQSEQLTGVLPNSYTDFSDEILSELLRIFNNSALDEVGGDVIGRIYEYFLNKFAKNIASDDGVFFTPKSLVKMIVNIIEPERGILLDPACGSGGMFIQSGDFVNAMGMNANSWKYDYYEEPLVAIVSTMISIVEEKTKLFPSSQRREEILGILKSAGVVLLSMADEVVKNKIGVGFQKCVDIVLNGKQNGTADYEDKQEYDIYFHFNKVLELLNYLLQEIAQEYTVVFLVDELDRCIPEYAIKVLERLHHLTEESTNLITIIAIDKPQLVCGIKKIFGINNPEKYLQKFINGVV